MYASEMQTIYCQERKRFDLICLLGYLLNSYDEIWDVKGVHKKTLIWKVACFKKNRIISLNYSVILISSLTSKMYVDSKKIERV